MTSSGGIEWLPNLRYKVTSSRYGDQETMRAWGSCEGRYSLQTGSSRFDRFAWVSNQALPRRSGRTSNREVIGFSHVVFGPG